MTEDEWQKAKARGDELARLIDEKEAEKEAEIEPLRAELKKIALHVLAETLADVKKL